jgi:hypothetical protein
MASTEAASFWGRLKDDVVFRVGTLYTGASWFLVQALDTLQLPATVIRGTALVLAGWRGSPGADLGGAAHRRQRDAWRQEPQPGAAMTRPCSHSRPASVVPALCLAFAIAAGCGSVEERATHRALPATEQATLAPVSIDMERVRAGLTALAHDTMEGRMTGSRGAARAARFIAREFEAAGLAPAGDSAGYFQRVPLARLEGGRRPFAVILDAAGDTFPAAARVNDVNVVGMLRGADPALRDQVIIVGAHFDHVGIRPHPSGDSIFNGADDDASGVIAMIEIARALRAGTPPKRSVLFVAFTGEEVGLLGTYYYLAHPVVPLDRTVAQLQIEMIGRPDSLAGGHGRAWLTGYERSTMGDMLSANGIPLVPDPRPDQRFFFRSDNIAFAYLGIPAHTISSFNLHTDYHQPTDDVSRIDFAHLTAVSEATLRALRLLADGEPPRWHPGGRPERQ